MVNQFCLFNVQMKKYLKYKTQNMTCWKTIPRRPVRTIKQFPGICDLLELFNNSVSLINYKMISTI